MITSSSRSNLPGLVVITGIDVVAVLMAVAWVSNYSLYLLKLSQQKALQ